MDIFCAMHHCFGLWSSSFCCHPLLSSAELPSNQMRPTELVHVKNEIEFSEDQIHNQVSITANGVTAECFFLIGWLFVKVKQTQTPIKRQVIRYLFRHIGAKRPWCIGN